VTGPDLPAAGRSELRGAPGVEQVVAFGTTLHVSGRDATRCARPLIAASVRPQRTLEQVDSGLGGRVHQPDGQRRRDNYRVNHAASPSIACPGHRA
jgi:hypothetical protein